MFIYEHMQQITKSIRVKASRPLVFWNMRETFMNGIRKLLRVTKTPCFTLSDKSQNSFVTTWTNLFSNILAIFGDFKSGISSNHFSPHQRHIKLPLSHTCSLCVWRKSEQEKMSQDNVSRILKRLRHNNCDVARTQNAGVNRTEGNRRIVTPYASIWNYSKIVKSRYFLWEYGAKTTKN